MSRKNLPPGFFEVDCINWILENGKMTSESFLLRLIPVSRVKGINNGPAGVSLDLIKPRAHIEVKNSLDEVLLRMEAARASVAPAQSAGIIPKYGPDFAGMSLEQFIAFASDLAVKEVQRKHSTVGSPPEVFTKLTGHLRAPVGAGEPPAPQGSF